MAVTVKNIMVGAGNLYVSATDNAKTPLPTFTNGQSANLALVASANWRDLGATQDGVNITYTPNYGEVEVDQLKDAAVMFNQGVTIMAQTNLAEATLRNLLVAWGFASGQFVASTDDTFSMGVPADAPVERTLAIVGKSPTSATAQARERLYLGRRCISVSGSNHAIKRTEATLFPVEFRLLPDPTYSGSEYGLIIDRTI